MRRTALSLVFILLAAALAVSPQAAASDLELSDEAVAEAAGFMSGPAAELTGYDVTETMTPSQVREYRSTARTIIDDLERSGELSAIIAEVRSGNPSRVADGLEELSAAITAAAEARYGAELVSGALAESDVTAGYGACSLVKVCYVAAAAHNTVAVTAFVAVASGGVIALAAAVWKAKWFWNGQADGASALAYDRYVADVTVAFGS